MRWCVLQEPDKRDTLNIGILKELSGNDTFFARGLYKEGKEITPMFKLAMICNKPPKVPHDDKATWNRIRVIPFEATFSHDAPENYEEQIRTKTFPIEHISPLIKFGHNHFGENKVQEAENKWKLIKSENNNVKIHMLGKLQSNKAKKAVSIFDFIHSVDSKKLADVLKKSENEAGKKLSYFIQVNFANEKQKGGISISEASSFYQYCRNELNLNIIGLMCFPPFDLDPLKFFKDALQLNNKLGLKELSMGMSNDYIQAIKCGSTFVRIGSAIFGERKFKKL